LTGAAWVEKGGEVFGEDSIRDSRCIEHASGVRPLCLVEHVCGQYGNEAGKVTLVTHGGKRLMSI